jgi:Flp pilus assembly protein TadG
MRKGLSTLARAADGSAIFEFMLVLPLMMMIGFGIWEFGRIFDAQLVATNAAREGARYAAAHSLDSTFTSDTQSFTYNYLSAGYGTRLNSGGDVSITSNQITVQIYDTSGNPSSTPQPQDEVVVTVPVVAKVYTPFVPGLSNQITLTGVATMRLQ